jgi:competence protein ComEC
MHRTLWIVLFFLLGLRIFFYFSTQENLPEGYLKITGVIKSEPLIFERQQRISMEGYTIYLPLYPALGYGDRIVVEGKAEDERIKNGTLLELKESTNILHVFRRRLLEFYKESLPTNAAALVAGTTIGSKQLLTQNFWEKLVATGTVHVVVASGMNITIVSKFLLDLFLFFLPRRRAIPFAISGIWIYAFLAGVGAPIVRAAIMATLAFLAQEMGKVAIAVRILVITSVVMLFITPSWIIDLSFLLSFAATWAILLFSKPIEDKLVIIPKIIRNDLSTSLAASFGVAPLLWWSFGRFNLFSPFINALVLWTIAPITLVGGVAGIVGLAIPELGRILLYLIYPLMWWFESIIDLFS